MPVSKGRNKKKKTKPAWAQQHEPDEIFEKKGVKLERMGKMTYLRNTRTEKEHQEYLESLPKTIAELDLCIKEGTEAIIAYFEAFDNIALLGGLSINHSENQTDKDDDGMAETILEYAINVCAALPYKNKPLPSWDNINELISNLRNLKMVYYKRTIAESVNDRHLRPDEDRLIELRFQAMLETLSIRGNGYFFHVRDLFLELFSGHDAFMLKHYGFTALDIVNTEKDFEDAWKARLGFDTDFPHPNVMMVFADWAFSKKRLPFMNESTLAEFQIDHPEYIVENGQIVTYSINNPQNFEGLFRIRFTKPVQEKVVRALSIKFGDNSDYLLPPANMHILADTKTRVKLFLQSDKDQFYHFALPLLSRNYLTVGQYLLENAPENDKKYFKKYYQNKQHSGSRDRFLEEKVEKLFRNFLPTVQFIPNTTYPLPDQKPDATNIEYTELDLLGVGKNYTYLIEVKAGELNAAGKRGAIDSLVNRIKKNVSGGDFQSNRAQNYIQDNDIPMFKDDKKEVNVNKSLPIFRIVVTLDTFAGLLAGASVLENADLINAKNGYPWIINIYDLMIFAEIIESEEDFSDYLNLRLNLNSWKEFSTSDEINLLGHFLSDQLNFEPRHKKLDKFMLNNYLQEIDAYFYDRQLGLPGKKPKRKKID